jgi:hypothetical protein
MSEETDKGDELDKLLNEGETPEAKPAEEPKPGTEPDKKEAAPPPEPQIPKSRFDEAVRKERADKEALEARVKAFEERDAQVQVSEDYGKAQGVLKDMIKQHTSFLADGELDKASNLMEQILGLNQAILERRGEHRALATKFAAKEEVQYDALVARLEVDHPQLNPDADEYDKDVVENIQALMAGFMQSQKLTAPQALARAVKTLITAPAKAAEKSEDPGLKRKEAAVKKALDAKDKQPASTGGVGVDHDKQGGPLDAAAVMKMNWEEFVKLPDSELSKMRGDHI